jgi:xylulokinase
MNSWLRKTLQHSNGSLDYEELNKLASRAPIGSEKLCVLPFGNGAERMLENADLGGSFHGLNFNRHQTAHVSRAIQEGIVFALGYGFEIIAQLGIPSRVIRAGQANMFQSKVFCEAFVNVTDTELQLYNTDGAQGAARGAGIGVKYYASAAEAFGNLECISRFQPRNDLRIEYQDAYVHWKNILAHQLEKRQKN